MTDRLLICSHEGESVSQDNRSSGATFCIMVCTLYVSVSPTNLHCANYEAPFINNIQVEEKYRVYKERLERALALVQGESPEAPVEEKPPADESSETARF